MRCFEISAEISLAVNNPHRLDRSFIPRTYLSNGDLPRSQDMLTPWALGMDSRSLSPEFSPLAIGEDLTPLPAYKEPSTTVVNFSNLLDPPLRLHEDLKSGCGGQLWPAGMVLAQHMLRYHKASLKDARMFVFIFLITLFSNLPVFQQTRTRCWRRPRWARRRHWMSS